MQSLKNFFQRLLEEVLHQNEAVSQERERHGVLAQAAITKYHRLNNLNNKLISHSSGGWKVQDQSASRFSSAESPLPCLQMAVFSLYPHVLQGAREPSVVSFIRELILFMRVPPLWLNHTPETLSPNTITFGVNISTHEFWGDTNI